MIGKVKTGVIQGVKFIPVTAEVTILPRKTERFIIVGLVDAAIREAKERVTAALQSCGFSIPKAVTVSLSPAEVRKEGSSLDLSIALALLVATGKLSQDSLSDISVFGELSLDASIKKIRAPLAYIFGAANEKIPAVLLPKANNEELVHVNSIDIFTASHLSQLVSDLRASSLENAVITSTDRFSIHTPPFEGVVGQHRARRALTLAAAGGHHLLMVGPPGCGKSLLASKLSNLLPPLTEEEQKELLVVTSIAGESVRSILNRIPPFRSPHHTVSEAGLVGGGSPASAGEITLAHRGVLFLDEFPEFKRGALESLRAPLENGWIEIARVKGSEKFPARFQLIAAMNPCPCGYYGSERCTCPQSTISRYLGRISGPMLDRFDLQTSLRAVPPSEVIENSESQDQCLSLAQSIKESRTIQLNRQGCLNRDLPGKLLLKSLSTKEPLKALIGKTQLSMRGTIRILRVAQTIADLEGENEVSINHLKEAISFRALDKMKE